MDKKVIITGATSGIGRALAIELHTRGYTVGLTGRRTDRLKKLKERLKVRVHIRFMDVTDPEESFGHLESLIHEMGGMDIIVLNAGVSSFQRTVKWEKELPVIDVNVRGFAALTTYAFNYFEEQGYGHIVGISSIASLFGYRLSATYNASKAFVSTFLQGYRQKANHSEAEISVTDVKPGYVKSEMTTGKRGMYWNMFWIAELEKAAEQLADAIEQKRQRVYITKRWCLIAMMLKVVPNRFIDRL